MVDWLEPEAFESKEREREFLDALSNTRPWICKGNSGKSKLVQELLWNGKMFGSFTQNEVDILKQWIDSVAVMTYDPSLYWTFIGQNEIPSDPIFQDRDICMDYPVFLPPKFQHLTSPPTALPLLALATPIKISLSPSLDNLLPLWFAHPSLLESFVAVPFKTTNTTTSAIIRVLRAQYGFAIEGPGVAGMDEVRRSNSVDLIELGRKMMKKAGLAKPACLKDVLDGRKSDFAIQMLHFSMRPLENREMLLGMAWAFVGLHDAITASSSAELLSEVDKSVLKEMGLRERLGLQFCLDELKADDARYVKFCRGFEMGKGEIEGCFV